MSENKLKIMSHRGSQFGIYGVSSPTVVASLAMQESGKSAM